MVTFSGEPKFFPKSWDWIEGAEHLLAPRFAIHRSEDLSSGGPDTKKSQKHSDNIYRNPTVKS
jgi:hypothetical protein